MGLYIDNKKIATGKATCKVCNQKIKKGVLAVYVQGYQTSGWCHLKCPKEELEKCLTKK